MTENSPAHFRSLPRWAIIFVVFAAFVLASLSIGLAWKQSSEASANLAFGLRDTEVVAAIARLAPSGNNDAMVVHVVNVMVNLKSITNNQALGVLAIGAGGAFLSIGFALFLIGADGAAHVQYSGQDSHKIAFYATAPGLLCFVLAASLIALGVTRKHDIQLGDYQSSPQSEKLQLEQASLAKSDTSKPLTGSREINPLSQLNPVVFAEFCIDRITPSNLARTSAGSFKVEGGRARAIMPIGKVWMNGSSLRVAFLDGDARLHKKVQEFAIEWSNYANFDFRFGSDKDAEIRVSFSEPGRWSYIGTDNRTISLGQATMNLGGLSSETSDKEFRSVVLHEFGHAIGLGHEHHFQPEGQWNEDAVIRVLAESPNRWTATQTRDNFLKKYSLDHLNGTSFDSESIMVLPIPASFLTGGVKANWNPGLSERDKQLVSGAQFYPKTPASSASGAALKK